MANKEHAWQWGEGVCMAGGVRDGGACVAGGVRGRGHAYRREGH